ncbi:MobF family relaxase (plasmid) [Brucella pituitosa]|uniref:MobF family relaxase n=1 Tax=Brucella pituitosa TaxID=571256 RepID=UPI003C740453
MTVGINKVAYIEYFTADQDSETEFDNSALDQMLTEDELAEIVASDIAIMKLKQQKSVADYYAAGTGEGGSDNAGGTLFKVVLSPEKEARIRQVKEGGKPTIGHGLRILDDFQSGVKIPTSVVRRLSEGVDPSTGETLSKKTKSFFDKARHHPEKLIDKNGEKLKTPRLGYDLTFSIDKAASVLWTDLRLQAEKTGDMRLVRKIENLVETSAAKSIQLMFDNDVFKTRRTITNSVLDPETGEMKQNRTEYLEPVLDITSALYLHKSARPTGNGNSNGDPQLHVHALVFNSVVRQDGTIGALENNELMRMRPVMDAAFKTAFYEGLLEIEELRHLDIIKRDKVVDIGGIDQKIIQEFSARREEILDELDAMDMPHTREASTIAAKNTRRTKDEQPNVQGLLPEWEAKIAQHSKDGIYADTKKHQREVKEESYTVKLERLAKEVSDIRAFETKLV